MFTQNDSLQVGFRRPTHYLINMECINPTVPMTAVAASAYHSPFNIRQWSALSRKNRNKAQRVPIIDVEGIDIKPGVADTMSMTPEIYKDCVIYLHFAASNQPLVKAVRVDANL